jgi:hypothetical protein
VATQGTWSSEQAPDSSSSAPFGTKNGLSIAVDDEVYSLPRPTCSQLATPTVIPPTPVDNAGGLKEASNGLDASKPPRTVRFYDRVRITSGVGHSNRTRSPTKTHSVHSQESDTEHAHPVDIDEPSPLRSGDSSASESYSSSISAPLRSSTDLPPRGSLSRMVRKRTPLSNMLDTTETNAWLRSLAVERRNRRRARSIPTDETTPLLQPVSPRRQREGSDGRSTRMSSSKSDTNAAYGRWPWRIFNLYVSAASVLIRISYSSQYWENQLIALCCCESDVEE